jgi:hypothetical protein
VTGALISAAALVCGGGQAIAVASAAPPAPAAGAAGVISTIAGFYHQGMTAGDIYTIAGGGTGGLGDGGPATKAVLMQPGAVLVDTTGDVLICDTADERIREVFRPAV